MKKTKIVIHGREYNIEDAPSGEKFTEFLNKFVMKHAGHLLKSHYKLENSRDLTITVNTSGNIVLIGDGSFYTSYNYQVVVCTKCFEGINVANDSFIIQWEKPFEKKLVVKTFQFWELNVGDKFRVSNFPKDFLFTKINQKMGVTEIGKREFFPNERVLVEVEE